MECLDRPHAGLLVLDPIYQIPFLERRVVVSEAVAVVDAVTTPAPAATTLAAGTAGA